MERDQLPHEKRDEAVRRRPARPEQPVLRTDEADWNVVEPCETGEEVRISFRIGDNGVRGTKRAAVDRLERPCGERAWAEPRAIGDESVGERDERIEDQRPSARGASCRG